MMTLDMNWLLVNERDNVRKGDLSWGGGRAMGSTGNEYKHLLRFRAGQEAGDGSGCIQNPTKT